MKKFTKSSLVALEKSLTSIMFVRASLIDFLEKGINQNGRSFAKEWSVRLESYLRMRKDMKQGLMTNQVEAYYFSPFCVNEPLAKYWTKTVANLCCKSSLLGIKHVNKIIFYCTPATFRMNSFILLFTII